MCFLKTVQHPAICIFEGGILALGILALTHEMKAWSFGEHLMMIFVVKSNLPWNKVLNFYAWYDFCIYIYLRSTVHLVK